MWTEILNVRNQQAKIIEDKLLVRIGAKTEFDVAYEKADYAVDQFCKSLVLLFILVPIVVLVLSVTALFILMPFLGEEGAQK